MGGLKKKLPVVLALAAVFTVCAVVASSQSLNRSFRFFRIDWIAETITVAGTGAVELGGGVNAVEQQLKAAREAEEELLRSFIASMQELRIDAYRSARDVLLEEAEKGGPLYAYFDRMERVSVRYGEHTVELQKSLPFFGDDGFIPLLVDAGTDPGNFPEYPGYVFSRPFTGLVIDARGLGKVPSAFPRVWDQSHILVYSAELMDRDQYRRWGSVQFTDDPFYRNDRERVGSNPLRIVAYPDERLIETDLAIRTGDARVLLQHEESRRSLVEGRVIVILDG